MTAARRGDVFWCETPAGRRPVVILTRDAAIPHLGRVLVALATTNVRGLPSEVTLEPGVDPVPLPCVLNLDTPEVVPVARLTQRLGALGSRRMDEVCAALAVAAGCDGA
jgi:mRNA interferase MazF